MKQNLAQNDEKRTNSKKYICELCDYITSHKGSFDRHIATRKHQRMKQNAKNAQRLKYQCEICDKILKSRTSLWRHKKKCFILFQTHNQKNGEIMEKNGKKTPKMGRKFFEEKIEEKTQEISLNNDQENLDFLKSKILDLENKLKKEKETKEEKLWEALNESQRLLKQSIEQNNNMIPRIGNNNNNKISINVILNEKCPDAMNLENFVKKMQVSIEDVMYTRTHGYVKGISNIMVKHLKDIPAKERPIHCSDQN